jgi:putative lipoic acid-binding regulatory protein
MPVSRNCGIQRIGRGYTFRVCIVFAKACEGCQTMSLPSVEMLESRHNFPCPFIFKVIGAAEENFIARVISEVRHELNMEIDPHYTMRSTKNGAHIAITLEPECESAQQVLAIYSRLSGMDGVVMLL